MFVTKCLISLFYVGTIGDKPEDDSLGPPFKPTGTCFRCGQDGHWARQCKGAQNNTGDCLLLKLSVVRITAVGCISFGTVFMGWCLRSIPFLCSFKIFFLFGFLSWFLIVPVD